MKLFKIAKSITEYFNDGFVVDLAKDPNALGSLARSTTSVAVSERNLLAPTLAMIGCLTLSGCALNPQLARKLNPGCTNDCSDDGLGYECFCNEGFCNGACGGDCLPTTVGAATPGATLASWQRCVQPIPGDAVPAPPGTYVEAWQEASWTTALQRHRLITRNRWFSGGDQLSPEGRKQLSRLAASMHEAPDWIVIENEPVQLEREESYDEALARILELQSLRRIRVVEDLVAAGINDADHWVVFGDDRSVGVRGIEAPQIFNRQFQNVGQGNRGGAGQGGFGGGQGGGFGGGLGGGFGGGGLGGGGGIF